jgi:hypothetical protein
VGRLARGISIQRILYNLLLSVLPLHQHRFLDVQGPLARGELDYTVFKEYHIIYCMLEILLVLKIQIIPYNSLLALKLFGHPLFAFYHTKKSALPL